MSDTDYIHQETIVNECERTREAKERDEAMNDTPTPETDALIERQRISYGELDDYNAPKIWVEHARQLERERDEARRIAGELRDYAIDFEPQEPLPWQQ